VDPLTTDQIRASFVNCSKRKASAVPPPDLAAVEWEHQDYLGWHDPKSDSRAYVVLPHDGRVVALALRRPTGGQTRRGNALCAICHAARDSGDVDLFVAALAGAAGRAGNTVGTYICADLACSLYARGRRRLERPQPEPPGPERVAGLRQRMAAFAERVLSGDAAA
jgi:hypothetical protein